MPANGPHAARLQLGNARRAAVARGCRRDRVAHAIAGGHGSAANARRGANGGVGAWHEDKATVSGQDIVGVGDCDTARRSNAAIHEEAMSDAVGVAVGLYNGVRCRVGFGGRLDSNTFPDVAQLQLCEICFDFLRRASRGHHEK